MSPRCNPEKPELKMFGVYLFLFGQIAFGDPLNSVTQRSARDSSYAVSSYCPDLIHFIEGKAVKFVEAQRRCESAKASLPRREPDQLNCLRRFFEDIDEKSLAGHFSIGVNKNPQEFSQNSGRLWFFGDDEHKLHGKRVAKGDQRRFVCTTPGNSRNGCNSSLVIHDQPLSFVDAQRFCRNSIARLPLRSKEEQRCFERYFPSVPYTWFDGPQPHSLQTLSSERCFVNISETNSECPPDLQFICVSHRFRVEAAAKTSVYFSNISTSKVILASKEVSSDEEFRSSFEATETEFTPVNHSSESTSTDSSQGEHRTAGTGTPIHDSSFVIVAQNQTYPVLYSTADAAVEFCFEKQENLKLLDREHTTEWFLTFALSTHLSQKFETFWVMPRESFEISSQICPYVDVNLTSESVSRGSRPCRQRALAVCEPRVCPRHFQTTLDGQLAWPAASPLQTISKPCATLQPGTYGSMSKTCSTIGYWQTPNGLCHSKESWFILKLSNLTSFDERTDWIRSNLKNDKAMLEVLYRSKGELIDNLNIPTDSTAKCTETFMNSVVRDAIQNVDTKTGLNQVTEISRDFLKAFGLKLATNQTVKSEEHESFGFALSNVMITSLTKGQPAKIVSQVRHCKVELTISGNFQSSSSVVVGHIVMNDLPRNVLAPNNSGPWAEAEVNSPLVEFFFHSDGNSSNQIADGASRVIISFQHLRPSTRKSIVKCVFYDPEAQHYSDYGCSYLANASTRDVSICVCNHTTSFAALLLPSEFAITHAQAKFLQYMTAIGMPLSMFCLLICIPIFTFIRQQHEERNTIHRNLCISLVAGDIVLIVSSYGDHLMSCTLNGSLVHFCFLSSLSWMGLEGVHIIHVMWLVFTKTGIPIAIYYIVGYGVPLMIVIATNFGFEEAYDRTAQLCFLSRENMAILTFMLPLIVIVCINSLAVSVVFYRMRTVKSAKDKDLLRTVQKWTRGVAVLIPLLGLPWIFGLLMLANDRQLVIVSAVIFNVFAILQGPGIFLTQVWFSNKKRDLIFRYLANKGRIAQFIARIFAHSTESTDSSIKSSKLSKSSASVRAGVQKVKS